MISATYRAAHALGCPYLTWFAQNARWQPHLPEGGPLHPLSLLVREIMVEELCSCREENIPGVVPVRATD